jgi:glucose-1-phosphate cytidylyltransferase
MKTIILCGGLGTRISEETIIKPKPMIEIGGYPIVWHIMKWYHQFGYNDFILALGYKGDYIKEYFLNYRNKKSDLSLDYSINSVDFINENLENWKLSLINTGELTMTGGRLLRLKNLFEDGELFMLTYGDGVSNIDIDKLVKFHKSHGKIATISAVRPPVRFGELFIEDNGIVSSFQEKPQAGNGWINGGFFVFDTRVFNFIENDKTLLEREPLEMLANTNELVAFKHDGFWQCMDTIRDRDFLQELWTKNEAPWKIKL